MCDDEATLVSLGQKIDQLTKEVHDLATEIKAARRRINRPAGDARLRTPAGPTLDNEELLNTEQVAALVKRTASTVKSWRSHGKGPLFHRLPGSQQARYRRVDVMKWLEAGEHNPPPSPRRVRPRRG